jgi:hypothetical protein
MISPATHYVVVKKSAAFKLNDLLPERVTTDQLVGRVVAAIQDPEVTWRAVPCHTGTGISAGVTLYGIPMVLYFAVPVGDNGKPNPAPDGRKWMAFLTGACRRAEEDIR